MRKITVSAPGKLMLFGEHSVVYNRPCLVTAVDSRMTIHMEDNQNSHLHITAPEVNITNYIRPIGQVDIDMPKGVRFIESVVKNMYQKFNLKNGINITTQNGFSSKYGLGSSSAVSVCTAKAIDQMHQLNLSKKQIFEIAYKSVLDVQGVGSGYDVAAAIWGGTLYYKTAGAEITPLKVQNIPLVVVYSGNKADTPTLIRKVEQRLKKDPQKINKIFDQITELVEKAKTDLEEQKWVQLGSIMNQNQKLLEKLGVSTSMIDSICNNSMQSGAYGAKITGAGGGDCVIVLTGDKNKHVVEQSVVKAGGALVPIDTGSEGVRVDN